MKNWKRQKLKDKSTGSSTGHADRFHTTCKGKGTNEVSGKWKKKLFVQSYKALLDRVLYI